MNWIWSQQSIAGGSYDFDASVFLTGFKTATTEQLPDAVAVMDPFHVVALAGDALDRCRQRLQQATCGHRGRTGDPLYGIRRVLRTGTDLLTVLRQRRQRPRELHQQRPWRPNRHQPVCNTQFQNKVQNGQ